MTAAALCVSLASSLGCGQNVMNSTFKHAIMTVHNTRRSQLKNGFERYVQPSYFRDPGVPKTTPKLEIMSRLFYTTVPNLPQLSWDSGLARKAQDWADTLACRPAKSFSHGDTGENIAWTTSRTQHSDLPSWDNVEDQMEQMWTEMRFVGYDQLRNFGNGKNSDGQAYGHFSQMAWAKTTKVGCGINLRKLDGKSDLITVCRYFPKGNKKNQPIIEWD